MSEPQASRGMGFSFPLGIPLLLDPLLIVGMFLGRGQWWGYLMHAAYLGAVGVFLWLALSRAQWEKIHTTVPTLTRANWVLNWMIFFVVVPALLWLFFGLRSLTGAPIAIHR